MIEYKDYAKFENLSELSEAIEIGLDIEFTRRSISRQWMKLPRKTARMLQKYSRRYRR